MITRDLGGRGAGVVWLRWNPPPLHVYDQDCEAANWYPLPRPDPGPPQHPGPDRVFRIPTGVFGDDPTDPAQQTKPRIATMGMIGRLHAAGVAGR